MVKTAVDPEVVRNQGFMIFFFVFLSFVYSNSIILFEACEFLYLNSDVEHVSFSSFSLFMRFYFFLCLYRYNFFDIFYPLHSATFSFVIEK